jgi:hypothetical protein
MIVPVTVPVRVNPGAGSASMSQDTGPDVVLDHSGGYVIYYEAPGAAAGNLSAGIRECPLFTLGNGPANGPESGRFSVTGH